MPGMPRESRPMTINSPFRFTNTYADQLSGLYEEHSPAVPADPRTLVINEELAEMLGRPGELLKENAAEYLSGRTVPTGCKPLAFAYAGHQFGHFSPRLGDGRALLLGEVVSHDGKRFDLQLKGSGPTPFSRGGDGFATMSSVLREYLMSEAMYYLGVPTTRALSAVATGGSIHRTGRVSSAVLCRVASSHIRVGTFEFFAAANDHDKLGRVLAYAIERHCPAAANDHVPAAAFLEYVAEQQASLIAHWMSLGFVHGVMNTDNVAVSGETIDYGPCAFMESYDLDTVFSSIDRGGRYRFGNQPAVGQWNLAQLANSLIVLLDRSDKIVLERFEKAILGFVERVRHHWEILITRKLGFADCNGDSQKLASDLIDLLPELECDLTRMFRQLTAFLRPAEDVNLTHDNFASHPKFETWKDRWVTLHGRNSLSDAAARMNRVNPVYVPRNHLVEAAVKTAEATGDLELFEKLLKAVQNPYLEDGSLAGYAETAPKDFGPFVTFCGT